MLSLFLKGGKFADMVLIFSKGFSMNVFIKKWGNSLATRIPKAVVEAVDLHLDQEVDIEAMNGKIIITPIQKKKEYKLEALLSQCEPGSMERVQEDNEWLNAEPVGREAW